MGNQAARERPCRHDPAPGEKYCEPYMIKVYEYFVPDEISEGSARLERFSRTPVPRSGILGASCQCAQPHIACARRRAVYASNLHEAFGPAAGPLPPPAGLDRVRRWHLARAGPSSPSRGSENPAATDRGGRSPSGKPDLGSRCESSSKQDRSAVRRFGRVGDRISAGLRRISSPEKSGKTGYGTGTGRGKTCQARDEHDMEAYSCSHPRGLPRLAVGFFGKFRRSLARGSSGRAARGGSREGWDLPRPPQPYPFPGKLARFPDGAGYHRTSDGVT